MQHVQSWAHQRSIPIILGICEYQQTPGLKWCLFWLGNDQYEYSLFSFPVEVVIAVSQLIADVIGIGSTRFQQSLSIINNCANSDKTIKVRNVLAAFLHPQDRTICVQLLRDLHRTRPSRRTWKTWRSASERSWWPRPRWRNTSETQRCWWTCSTASPSRTPARPNYARPGWIAWPASTWRTETCQRSRLTHLTAPSCCYFLTRLNISRLTRCSHLQAAMCYVHVAALVAEYLRRKGASARLSLLTRQLAAIYRESRLFFKRCLGFFCLCCMQGWSSRAARPSASSLPTLTKRRRWWRTWACRTSISMRCKWVLLHWFVRMCWKRFLCCWFFYSTTVIFSCAAGETLLIHRKHENISLKSTRSSCWCEARLSSGKC